MVFNAIFRMLSVPITTKAVSLNPVHGKVYSIQHYVIKFVSDLVGDFLWLFWFLPPIKSTATIYPKYCIKYHNLYPNPSPFFDQLEILR
jgi:hypothetical protein